MKFSHIVKTIILAVLATLLVSGGAYATPIASSQAAGISSASPPTPATAKRPLTSPTGLYRAIKMTSARDGWIVGQGGLIKRYMAGQWLDYPSPITTTLNAVSATPADTWAVGEGNTILHLVGSVWQQVASPAPAASDLVDVDIVAPGEVWVIGSPAVMLHYSGGSWSLGPTPPSVGPISWGSPTDAWMVNDSSTAYHYSNGSWSATNLYGSIAESVFMQSPDQGWIGLSTYSFEGSFVIEYLRYTSAYGWVGWPPRGGAVGPCLTPADCATAHPVSPPTLRPAAPACTDSYSDIYSLIAFTTTDFYAAPDVTFDDCVSNSNTYYYLWQNQVNYNRSDFSLGETYTHTVGLSGSSGNDLWMLGNETISHWDGTIITVAPSCANPYTDVPASFYALSQIEYLTCLSIVNGTSSHSFSPNASASRIQFAKMISLARGWPLVTPTTQTFSDVPPSDPLYTYVETAYANGAISGATQAACTAHQVAYPCFLPNDLISRAQAALITVRAFGWPIDTTGGPHFTDVPTSNFAYGAIETCYHRRVVNGIGGGLFAPNANVTRAQLAVMLYKALTNP